nr:hypothetical protein [uncultured Kingella sp.]
MFRIAHLPAIRIAAAVEKSVADEPVAVVDDDGQGYAVACFGVVDVEGARA